MSKTKKANTGEGTQEGHSKRQTMQVKVVISLKILSSTKVEKIRLKVSK